MPPGSFVCARGPASVSSRFALPCFRTSLKAAHPSSHTPHVPVTARQHRASQSPTTSLATTDPPHEAAGPPPASRAARRADDHHGPRAGVVDLGAGQRRRGGGRRGPLLRPRLLRLLRPCFLHQLLGLRVRRRFHRPRLHHLPPPHPLRLPVLRRPLLRRPTAAAHAATQVLRLRAHYRQIQGRRRGRPADAELRGEEGSVLRRPAQLRAELQQRAVAAAVHGVPGGRRRRVGHHGGAEQAAAFRGRHQAVPHQDLAAAPGRRAGRRGEGIPSPAQEPVGVGGRVAGGGARALPPRRLACREAGRHRRRHRALQGVAPPSFHVGVRLAAAAFTERSWEAAAKLASKSKLIDGHRFRSFRTPDEN